MREDWPIEKLDDLCEIQLGKTPARKNSKLWDNKKNTSNTWVSISDLKHGQIIHDSKENVSDKGAEKIKISPKGTLLLSFKLTIGRISFAGKDLFTNEAIASLIKLDSRINKWFLYYYFSFFNWEKLTEGDVKLKGKTLNKSKLKNIPIPIPPPPEQKRIVEILDKTFETLDQAKSNIKRNIEGTEKLFQSKLNEIFSQRGENWENKPLGELTYVKSGGTPRRSTKEYWDNGTIPWYSSGELNHLFTDDSERLITEKGLDESNAKLFPEGSLLIGMYDTAALKMSILDRDGAFNQAISGVKPTKDLNLQFVMHAINANKKEILRRRRGIRQKNLNLTKIKAISIPCPKVEIQNEVVSKLSELRNYTTELIQKYQSELQNLEELKNSILQKAFSGELTANEHVAA